MNQENIKKEAYFKPPFFMSYFITDPEEFGNTPLLFEQSLRDTLSSHSIDMICFRDKSSSNKKELAKICLKISREYNVPKVLINSDIELCNELGFDGVHLNSLQFDKLQLFQSSKLFTIISCHNESEILKAKKLKADAITYSPIFYKEKKGEPKGLENLSYMVDKYQDDTFKIIALGGIITSTHVENIIQTNANGFASIRYFKI